MQGRTLLGCTLSSVSTLVPPDIWAVGEHEVLYGNGRTRVRVPSPLTEPLRALDMVADDGWSVGYAGLIVRYSPSSPLCRLYLPNVTARRAETSGADRFFSGGRP